MQQPAGLRWFKGPVGPAVQVQCTLGIYVPALAAELRLKARPLKINGVMVNSNEQGYMPQDEIARIVGELGQLEGEPILVDGQSAETPSVMLHIQQGSRKLPSFPMPIEQGAVNLMQVPGIDPFSFEKVAVSNGTVSEPSYEPLDCLLVPAKPGQHMYILAKSAGGGPGATTAAAGSSIPGPPYSFRWLVKNLMPPWRVTTASTSTHARPLEGCRIGPWVLGDASDIMAYVQQECGELQDQEPLYTARKQHLTSENMCNSEFDNTYATVAARMVSQMRPGVELTSSVNPAGNPLLGLPDFVFTSLEGGISTALLVGEGKTPSVMKSASYIFAVDNSSMKQQMQCVEQLASHMFVRGRRYGFLTYLNGTMFVRRTGDLEFIVTEAISPSRGDPTVLEMLVFILLRQYDEGPWVISDPDVEKRLQVLITKDQADKRQREQQQQQQQLGQQGSSVNNFNRPVTRQYAARHRSYADHKESDIAIFNEALGSGMSGIVLSGCVRGQRVALKSADIYKQPELFDQLEQEVDALEHLATLQGGPVPKLVECGFVQGMDVFFLATGIVPGEHPCSRLSAALPAALEALSAIHSQGVLHGDIRAENVLVQQVEGVWKACFLDFGCSTFSFDRSCQEQEILDLQMLFQRPR